jgi:hypothetical protein
VISTVSRVCCSVAVERVKFGLCSHGQRAVSFQHLLHRHQVLWKACLLPFRPPCRRGCQPGRWVRNGCPQVCRGYGYVPGVALRVWIQSRRGTTDRNRGQSLLCGTLPWYHSLESNRQTSLASDLARTEVISSFVGRSWVRCLGACFVVSCICDFFANTALPVGR